MYIDCFSHLLFLSYIPNADIPHTPLSPLSVVAYASGQLSARHRFVLGRANDTTPPTTTNDFPTIASADTPPHMNVNRAA